MVAVPLMNASACQAMFKGIEQSKIVNITSNICTFLEGLDVDEGDEGGPLFCDRRGRAILVGIASWGLPQKKLPFVYSKISFYRFWIKATAEEM